MKAVVIDRFGDVDVLRDEDVPVPEPGAGELRVRVRAVGTNPVDTQNRANGSWARLTAPAILGYDVAGTVDAISPGAGVFAPGDAVFYMSDFFDNRFGAYAEYHVAPASFVVRKPGALSFVEAAAVPLAGLTALQTLDRLRVAPGDALLVYGAAGGVGSFAVQIAVARGALVVAVASRKHEPLLSRLGVRATLDYRLASPAAAAAAAIGRQLDAVADFAGQGGIADALPVLRTGGSAASVVSLGSDLDLAIDRNVALHGVLVRPNRPGLLELANLVERGAVKPVIRTVLPLTADGAKTAHFLLESGHGAGKIVLEA